MGDVWEYTFHHFDEGRLRRTNNDEAELSLDNATPTKEMVDFWKQEQDSILVYFTRHCQAAHNSGNRAVGKNLFYKFLARATTFFDPPLTGEGKGQAREVSKLYSGLKDLRPQKVFTSPLKRCISTAMSIANGIGQTDISVLENLREWMGWDHNHSSDKRSNWANVLAIGESQNVVLEKAGIFPERDNGFKNESFVQVDRRVRDVLNTCFDSKKRIVALTLHNRIFQSFPRVGYHYWDNKVSRPEVALANGSTIAIVITRERLGEDEVRRRDAEEHDLHKKEVAEIKRKLQQQLDDADEDLKKMNGKQIQALFNAAEEKPIQDRIRQTVLADIPRMAEFLVPYGQDQGAHT